MVICKKQEAKVGSFAPPKDVLQDLIKYSLIISRVPQA